MNSKHVIGLSLFIISGCAVGPDYHPIDLAQYDGPYECRQLPCPQQQSLETWWENFNDPVLSSLVTIAAEQNLDIVQAKERVTQARAAQTQVRAAFLPSIGVSADARRSKSSSPVTSANVVTGNSSREDPSNQFQTSADLSWEIDLFGSIARQSEAAHAALQASISDQYAIKVSLLSEVASTYLQYLGVTSQLAVINKNIAAQSETADLTRQRFNAGFTGALEVASTEGVAATTKARLAPLEAAQQTTLHTLAVLLGQQPTALNAAAKSWQASRLKIPDAILVDLPSDLLRQRPDVLRAEANLRQATAQVGVATAELFPKFSISAALGVVSGDISNLTKSSDNEFWNLGGVLSLPVFNAGRLIAGIDFAESSQREAFAAYHQTILAALQEVQSAKVNYEKEKEHLKNLDEANRTTQQALQLSQEMYEHGLSDFLVVLDAQRSALNSENELTLSQTQLATNAVILYRALGGGW